jgi:1-deoxy-D-xylulose-5-phosphate reductoisomerase
VEAFHAGKIGFTDICDIVAGVLTEHVAPRGDPRASSPLIVTGSSTGSVEPSADVGSTLVADDDLTVDLVLAADAWARRRAWEFASTQEHPH